MPKTPGFPRKISLTFLRVAAVMLVVSVVGDIPPLMEPRQVPGSPILPLSYRLQKCRFLPLTCGR